MLYAFAFAFFTIVIFAPLSSHAQSSGSIRAQIDAGNEQIEKLKEEISKLQIELNTTSKQAQTLQNAVKELDLNIQKLTKSISLTQAQITQKDRDINSLSGDISSTNVKIDDSQERIGNLLRQLDTLEGVPTAIMLLAGGTLSSFFDEAATLAAVRLNLQNYIADLSYLKNNLETNKSSAEGKRKELAGLQKTLSQEKQGLTIARAAQSSLLTETKNKESTYQVLIAQKQAEQAEFERTLFELASGIKGNLGSIPPPGSLVLRWPLDNVFVTQEFGKTVDSVRLYTSGTHDGIDMRASIGMPVRAALSGTVAEINQGAVSYCQYGKWVLIRHDNGLSTLYAHLSGINVSKGQRVSTSEVIGFAGNTGYATGPHLHFTVYAGNAVSLKQYTCKSGSAVVIPIASTDAYLNPLSYLQRL